MRATIHAMPRFELEITSGVVAGLLLLSRHHYDGTCQMAGRPGGFLWGWKNSAEWAAQVSEPTVVTGSFRDLDLTLKICECLTVLSPCYYRDIVEYRTFVRALLNKASGLATGDWPSVRVES